MGATPQTGQRGVTGDSGDRLGPSAALWRLAGPFEWWCRCGASQTTHCRQIYSDYRGLPRPPFFAIDLLGGCFHSVRADCFFRWSQAFQQSLQIRLPQGTHPFLELLHRAWMSASFQPG